MGFSKWSLSLPGNQHVIIYSWAGEAFAELAASPACLAQGHA